MTNSTSPGVVDLREGKKLEKPTTGETLKPPMPTQLLKQLNEDEITALWEYLKTLD